MAIYKRIVFNRIDDGGVSVCCPTEWAMRALCNGGAWPDMEYFYPGFDEVQIERLIASGVRKDAAVRYAKGMMAGGFVTNEAFEIIRDKDCSPIGTAIELWNVDDLPSDRWFRNAWRRSANGGPIDIDLERARDIQFKRIIGAARIESQRREESLLDWQPLELDMGAIRRAIMRVDSAAELRAIWPKELRLNR